MRALLILLTLTIALPVMASRDDDRSESPGSTVAVSQGGDDTLVIAVPQAPPRTSLSEAQAICATDKTSVFCVTALEEIRIPLFCQRLWGHFGLVDLPFAGAYCY